MKIAITQQLEKAFLTRIGLLLLGVDVDRQVPLRDNIRAGP